MITQERIETNQLLMEMVGLDLTEKSLKDNLQAERYYTLLSEHIESQIQSAINWIDSDSAREFFFNDAYHQAEIWDSLEEDWDTILSGEYETIDDLLEEVYDYGKSRGYSDMAETLRYTPTDRLAFAFARNYNYGLIQNLDSDLRGAIKDRMTRAAIQGENPYSLAPHLRKLGLTQLPGSTFTPYQRAVLIARTETSRIQNTGILQSYVNEGYTRVKILTACDDNVCTICLKYAFEYNENDKVTYENRGPELVHDIKTLLKGKEYPPFHPQCRCTYLSVWEGKTTPPDNPYTVDLTPQSYDNLSGLFNSTAYTGKPEKPEDRFQPLQERIFKQQIKGFVNDSDIEQMTKLLKTFINDIPDVHKEFGAANLFGDISIGFGDWENTVVPPYVVREFGLKYNIPILIHNHPYNSSPFPSAKDFAYYAKYGVHYGVVTNDLGTFIVKNNNIDGNKNNFRDITVQITKIKKDMIEEFKTKYGHSYNNNNDDDIREISIMVNENSSKYIKQYQEALNGFDMEVIFI